ncbi:hypothetical protein DFH07DRAFT_145689 [Mycena maculata]|uniref:Cupin type-2 domain-containing protein n=1 Tax=Mycena maculata TaxID=230809 RepID=A0AAD7JVR6_9AGAR|nr:hypothetical protein DFH07DRAFT_145689 [Mycena maculata]
MPIEALPGFRILGLNGPLFLHMEGVISVLPSTDIWRCECLNIIPIPSSVDQETSWIMAASSTELPDARLVVTGHAPDGTSIFTFDNIRKSFAPFGPTRTHFTSFHAAPNVPLSNTAPYPDLSGVLPRCPPAGVLFCITDIQPGASTPLHRTLSVDYATVLSGQIVCILDGGDERTIRAGEFVVQRGASHAWHNRTPAPCRILVVKVGAEKIVLGGGEPLDAKIFGRRPDGVSQSDSATKCTKPKVHSAGAIRSGWFDDKPSTAPKEPGLSLRQLWTTFNELSRQTHPPPYSP